MKLALLAVTASILIAEPTICGARPANPYVDHAEVACVDFDALAKLSPFFVGKGKQTQVLIHAKRGDVASATVGGVTKYTQISTDSYGRKVAMLVFDGIEHTSVEIKVLTEEK